MKTALFIIATVLTLAYVAGGATQPPALAWTPQYGTLLSATPTVSTNLLNSSNTNGSAYLVEWPLYHTFQITTTCTNSASLILDRSVNSIGWIPFSTNTVTATGTNEVTAIGKWQAVRARFTGSNATCTVIYIGGR